jgi:hypothetical protein
MVFGVIVFLAYILRMTSINLSQPQSPFLGSVTTPSRIKDDRPERIALVVASQTTDNTTWLEESFPTWEKAIYLTDAPSNLSVPVNKGRESMVYLTFVIPCAISGPCANIREATSSTTTTTFHHSRSFSTPIDTSGTTTILFTMADGCCRVSSCLS